MTDYAQENPLTDEIDYKKLACGGVAAIGMKCAAQQIADGDIKGGLAIGAICVAVICIGRLKELNLSAKF